MSVLPRCQEEEEEGRGLCRKLLGDARQEEEEDVTQEEEDDIEVHAQREEEEAEDALGLGTEPRSTYRSQNQG